MIAERIPWALVPATLLAWPAQAAPYEQNEEGWFMPWHGYGHMMFGGLMMLVFWILLIVIVVLAVRWLLVGQGQQGSSAGRSSALQILEERYARGEIDREEFEERRRHLQA